MGAYIEHHPNMKYQLAFVLVIAAMASAAPNQQINQGIANVKSQAAQGLNNAQNWIDSVGIDFNLSENLNTMVQATRNKLNSQETRNAINSRIAAAEQTVNSNLNKIG